MIVVVLFGVGRISRIAGEMGSGIRAFREGLQSDQDEEDSKMTPEEKAAFQEGLENKAEVKGPAEEENL